MVLFFLPLKALLLLSKKKTKHKKKQVRKMSTVSGTFLPLLAVLPTLHTFRRVIPDQN